MEISQNYLKMQQWSKTLEQLKLTISKTGLRERFIDKPIRLHKTYPSTEPMNWPLVIRNAYAQIWSGRHPRIIIKAPRGGGKSKLLGTVGFDLWYLKQRKVVNMGGSQVQASIVYGYFANYCDIDADIQASIDGKVKAAETLGTAGNYFSSVTASSKQTRGKHPDVLLSDETCETDDELVHSALPMVDSSQNPMVVMASTFHKIFGIFQETWDNADERGYLRISWDIFDVCKPFPADYWENGVLSNGTKICDLSGIDKLKKYARGRTGDPDGWVPIENIIQAWREKPTEDWFEVEYLGSRPSAAGLVLKPEDVDRAMFDSDAAYNEYRYIKGATVVLGIDWGFSTMTALTEWMGYRDNIVVQLDNENFHQVASDDIIKVIVRKVKAKNIKYIYADSAGKFENVALQNALIKAGLACKVIEVVFSVEKEQMLGNLRAHFESGKIKIPRKVKRVYEDKTERWVVNESYWQYKRYRYQEGTDKPVKKDDHIPDSTMCGLQHFQLQKVTQKLPSSENTNIKKDKEVEQTRNRPITANLNKKVF